MADWIDNHLLAHGLITAVVLVVVCIGVAVVALRRESVRGLAAAGGVLLLAVATLVADWSFETPGERSEAVVRALVRAAEAGDLNAMIACFDPDASIHYGTGRGPGHDFSEIERGLSSLQGRHKISSNRITHLSSRTEHGRGIVDLSCVTETASTSIAVPTQWSFTLRTNAEGAMAIDTITWLRVFRDEPRSALW